jgi:hypothetical protein
MKKIITILCIVLLNNVSFCQVAKPTVIAKPNTDFLTHLQKIAQSITEKKGQTLNANTQAFVNLLKTAKTAASWKNTEYKTFMKQATPYINAFGVKFSATDGGEKLSADPDDGGEIFASSKMLIKALNQICTNTICPICCCLFPTDCKGKLN